MATSHVMDAHALVWYLEDNPRLGTDARSVMEDPQATLLLPAIALAEACWVVEAGRTRIPTVAALLADVDADARIVVVPLDRELVGLSAGLAAVGEMHDRQIVATALRAAGTAGPVPLLSRDPNILASSLVPVVW